MIQKESTYQKTSVCLPYKIAYAEVVASFAYNTAKVFGASDPTAMQLRQIAEESFVFAVGEGVHHSDDEYVLSMHSDEKGVVIECLYKGLPLTLRKAYTTSGESLSKDAELDSISLTMLRNMVDSISFEDCGINGWKITLRKDCDLTPLIEDKEPAKVMADENSVYNTFATPEDAYDIAVTTYKTYGTTYYDTDFYVPDLIAQHIEKPRSRTVTYQMERKDFRHVGICSYHKVSCLYRLCHGAHGISEYGCRKEKSVAYLTKYRTVRTRCCDIL